MFLSVQLVPEFVVLETPPVAVWGTSILPAQIVLVVVGSILIEVMNRLASPVTVQLLPPSVLLYTEPGCGLCGSVNVVPAYKVAVFVGSISIVRTSNAIPVLEGVHVSPLFVVL